jgi:hypothetical protein
MQIALHIVAAGSGVYLVCQAFYMNYERSLNTIFLRP